VPEFVPNDSGLIKRVPPVQMTRDKKTGTPRPTSGAFTDPNMSVDIEAFLARHGKNLQDCLAGFPGYSLIRLIAGNCRALNQEVVHCPVEKDNQNKLPPNPTHGEVRGPKPQSVQKELYKMAEILVLGEIGVQ
jgi:hypothetical protein